jgi:enamine deaminase RidA (YjgF/YER057c/UK114 family)
MTGAQRINPTSLYRGAPYDYAAVAPAGRLVFAAGACPLDAAGEVVAPGDLEAQARQAVENLVVALAEAGAGLDQVLKTTVFVAARDRSELVRAWTVVAERFGDARPPSTLLGVSVLGYPGQLVEIEAVAWTS